MKIHTEALSIDDEGALVAGHDATIILNTQATILIGDGATATLGDGATVKLGEDAELELGDGAEFNAKEATGGFYPPQIATQELPAAANHEGMLVYDLTLNKLVFSNGTAWETIESDVPE